MRSFFDFELSERALTPEIEKIMIHKMDFGVLRKAIALVMKMMKKFNKGGMRGLGRMKLPF